MLKNVAFNFHVNNIRGKLVAIETMFKYVVANLCVKTDVMLLFPIRIPIGGSSYKLEECAMVGIADDKHFEILPTNKMFIPQITKGIILKHPLLSVDIKEKEEDDEPDVLLVTMPEMTKERRDTLKDVIKVKYEQIKGQMEKEYADAVAEATSVASKVKPEELDECKKELEKAHDDLIGLIKSDYESIIEYIEKEYEAYCAGDVEQQRHEAEDNAAMDDSVAKKMKL